MRQRTADEALASIGFAPDLYSTLEDIAQQKQVSLVVVWEAAENVHRRKTTAFGNRRALVMSVYPAGVRRA